MAAPAPAAAPAAAPPAPAAAAPANPPAAAADKPKGPPVVTKAPRAADQNKIDEPPFQLKLEPDAKIAFKSDKLDEGTHDVDVKLTNTSKQRQTYKV